MKKLIFILSLTIELAYAQQKRSLPAVVKPSVPVNDSTNIQRKQAAIHNGDVKTLIKEFRPLTGDNYEALQQAIDFYINSGIKLKLAPGDYYISHPLVIGKIVNGKYVHATLDIEGAVNAKNAAAGITSIIPMYTEGFGIGVQLGKSVHISNLLINGKYIQPGSFSVISVDTLNFSDWDDHVCGQNASSPYAGIVIDFASDPVFYDGVKYKMYPGLSKWYLPGMSRSGSTQVMVEGVSIQNFVVGFIVSPSNQQNGEIIHLYHCQIQKVKVAYALCQAQSKQCEVRDLEVWAQCHTIFDNMNWGFRHGDGAGSPMVEGVNSAGPVHQLFNMSNYTFSAFFSNIYAESIFKLGEIGGWAGATLINMTIHFGNGGAGKPTPDFYLRGVNVTHIGCDYRLYPGAVKRARIIMNSAYNTFIGGSMNQPPVCLNTDGTKTDPVFINVSMWPSGTILNRNNYDSLKIISRNSKVYVDKNNFSGFFISKDSFISIGDLILTRKQLQDQFSIVTGMAYPVGFVSSISHDTIYLQNIGQGINDGEQLMLWDSTFK